MFWLGEHRSDRPAPIGGLPGAAHMGFSFNLALCAAVRKAMPDQLALRRMRRNREQKIGATLRTGRLNCQKPDHAAIAARVGFDSDANKRLSWSLPDIAGLSEWRRFRYRRISQGAAPMRSRSEGRLACKRPPFVFYVGCCLSSNQTSLKKSGKNFSRAAIRRAEISMPPFQNPKSLLKSLHYGPPEFRTSCPNKTKAE